MTFKQELQELSLKNNPLSNMNIAIALREAALEGQTFVYLDCYDERVVQWLKSENFEVEEQENCATYGDRTLTEKRLFVSWK